MVSQSNGTNTSIGIWTEMTADGQLGSHRVWIAEIELSKGTDQPTENSHLKVLKRYVNSDMTDHWTTTQTEPSNYTFEVSQGKIAANPCLIRASL